MRRPLLCLGLSTFAALPALAADPVPAARPLVAPLVNCPPVVLPYCPPGSTVGPAMPWQPGMPGTPGVPGTLPPVIDPSNPGATPVPGGDAQPQPNAGADSQFARQSEAGTQAAATIAPNMWGDILGARSLKFSVQTLGAFTFGTNGSTGPNLFVIPSSNASHVSFQRTDGQGAPDGSPLKTIQGGFGNAGISFNQSISGGVGTPNANDLALAQAALRFRCRPHRTKW